MPKAQRKGAAAATPAPVTPPAESKPTGLGNAIGFWHVRLNHISGEMVLCYKTKTVKRSMLRAWVIEMRALADAMDKF